MNKSDKAILLAILQDIKSALTGDISGSAASTASIAMSDVKRDGLDKQDLHNIAANSVLDQTGNVMDKIMLQFEQHPEIVEELDKFADENGLMQSESDNYLYDLGELISAYLKQNEVSSFGEGGQFESDLDTVSVKIGDKTYDLLYLVSEEEKERGLQDVEDMEDSEGALFDYSDNPQESLSFWMKDTTIPLTILFINKDGVVISSHDGKPLSEELITEEKEPVYWVIELNQSQRIPQGAYTNLALRQSPEEELEEDNEVDEDHPELKVNKLYIYGSDGEVQGEIDPGCRIFSRKSTEVIIKKAKKAYASKLDKDYKALGRYVFNEIQAQDNRPAEYV